MKKKLYSLLITLAILASLFTIITVLASGTEAMPDAMTDIEAELADQYRISDGVITIADDGYIGIPVELSVYFDTKNEVIPGSGMDATPIAVYVVNSNIERIGTDSDVSIIQDMLDRGFMVVILDYLNNPRATTPDLDWSVQGIRASIKSVKYFSGIEEIPAGSYPQNLTVPAGYTAEFNLTYWEMDKHGADGTLEYIVSVWNNDFRNYFAHKSGSPTIIKWVDDNGNRKKTQNGYDGSSPVWYSDAKGTVVDAENGTYIDVEYTLAETITDCVKSDGSPIDLSLYMHIVYPKNPGYDVPVMCLANSNSHSANTTQSTERPHLNGFVFNGYVGITFDYGYVPMGRDDHYSYFEVGSSAIGQPTGDNVTYSVQFYNDKKINTAAMRFIRYLSLSESETYQFDREAIGVYGNSKGGWMAFLGEEHPELMAEYRIFEGHSGETRYEAGLTETVGVIDGGEEQPWLEYNNVTIDSGADFVFTSCGTGGHNISENHAPTFITANLNDGTFYDTSNEVINACREQDIPTVWFEVPLGHTIAVGKDMHYGVDVYDALFAFTGYYLKGDAVEVLYIHRDTDYTYMPSNAPIIVKFSGAVAYSEIAKITVKDANGNSISGKWSSAFGDTEWTFVGETLTDGMTYTVTVPAGIVGDNGLPLASTATYNFNIGYEIHSDSTTSVVGDRGTYYSFTVPNLSSTVFSNGATPNTYTIRVKVENDAANALYVYTVSGFDKNSPDSSTRGALIDTIYLYGQGYYDVDVTSLVKAAKAGDTLTILLTQVKSAGMSTVFELNFENGTSGIAITPSYEITEAPGGSLSLSVSEFPIRDKFQDTHAHYVNNNGTILTSNAMVKSGAITASDLGRRFTISFSVYDTVSRFIQVNLSGLTSKSTGVTDYDRIIKNVITKAGEWVDVEIEYVVYDPLYENAALKTKTLTITAEHTGLNSAPLYIDNLKSVETVTPVTLGDSAELLISTTEQRTDPYITKYGTIPSMYFDDIENYPFLVFNTSGECVHATNTLISVDTKSALGFAQTKTDVDLIILLRRDYVWSGDVSYNLSFIKGNILIDLDGHSLTTTTTPFNAQGKSTYATNITIINGTILLENKPLVDITGITASSYDSQTAVKQFNFVFDDVDFGYISGAAGAPIIKNSWSSGPANASVIFYDCTFDLNTNVPSALSTMFSIKKIEQDYIKTSIKVSGGTIIAKDMSATSMADIGGSNSFEFLENEQDEYTVLRVASSGAPVAGSFNTSDGYRFFKAISSENGYTDYALVENPLSTPYGVIPDECANVDDYPVVYFHLQSDGSYKFNNAGASFFASEYASRGKDAVMFVRKDCSIAAANNLGLHKNLTIDLNEHTLTFTDSILMRPTKDTSNGNSTTLSLTFKNGYIIVSGSKSLLYRANSTKSENTTSNLSFENVKFSKINTTSSNTPFVTYEDFAVNANVNVTYTDCIFDIGNFNYTSLTLFKAGDSAGGITCSVTVKGGEIITNNFTGLTLYKAENSKSSVVFNKNESGSYTKFTVESAVVSTVPAITVNTDKGSRIFGMTSIDDTTGTFEPVFTASDLTLSGYSVTLAPMYASPELYPIIYLTKSGNAYVFSKASTTLFSTVSGANDEVSLRNYISVAVLRCDYTFANVANNLGSHSNVTFDLGGYTLTVSSSHNLRPDASSKVEKLFTFKNGTIKFQRTKLISVNTSDKMNGALIDIVFEDITFVVSATSAFTSPAIEYGASFAGVCTLNQTYKNCTFDLSGSTGKVTLFATGSSDGKVTGKVTVLGGDILLNTSSLFAMTSSAHSSSVFFGEGVEGYTTLSVKSGSAPSGYYTAENGSRLAFTENENGGYKLAVIFSFMGAGVNLTNDINVIWHVQVPNGHSDIYVTFKLGDDEIVTVREYTIDENGIYVFVFNDITPDRMVDTIVASVYADGKLQAIKSDFSIKSYCEYLLETYATDTELVTLVSDLLVYGKHSQIYVDYKTDELVTDGLDINASESPELNEDSNKLSISTDKADGIAFEGIGLILDSSLAFRLAFTANDVDGLTISVSIGNRKEVFNVSDLAYGNGKYLLIYDGITAVQFDELITIEFEKNGQSLGTSITYSINSYVYYIRGIEAPDNLAALVEAIARYGASAKAYNKSRAK